MADKHILSLEIPTVSNCDLLCIKDTSQYSKNLAVDCEELLITLPGYSVPVLIKVDKSSDMCLTACTLATSLWNIPPNNGNSTFRFFILSIELDID